MTRKPAKQTPHNEAVAIIEQLVKENLGGSLEAIAECNQCREELKVNIVAGAATLQKEKSVGVVRPDLSLYDESGEPFRFIEVVDSHAPERNVHGYALKNGIEIIEFHLRANREFTGRRRNRALDESLTVKARLQELAEGRFLIDAYNLLCQRPKCMDCGTPFPSRKVTIRTTDCWNCGRNVNVAVGSKDDDHLRQDDFTREEMSFAQENGVMLERRFSATVGGKYVANVCIECDQIQGNWFLYMDPFHDRFNVYRAEKQGYGPCDNCAARYCLTHGEYLDYKQSKQCPSCLEESERVMCKNMPERECFYPQKCESSNCYFLNREEQKRLQQKQLEQEWERQQEQERKRRQQQAREQNPMQQEFSVFREWFDQRRKDQEDGGK